MAAIAELLASSVPAVRMAVIGDAPSMPTLDDGSPMDASYGMDQEDDEADDDEQVYV